MYTTSDNCDDAPYETRYHGQEFHIVSKVSEDRLTGYSVLYEPSGKGGPALSEASRRASEKRTVKSSETQHSSHNLKPLLQRAARLADEMIQCAETSDLVALANSGFSLIDSLDGLWALRLLKGPDWGDLVNLLRTALTKIEFERLSTDQCRLISRFINECVCSGTAEREEHQLGLQLLRKANLDPWNMLSEPDCQ